MIVSIGRGPLGRVLDTGFTVVTAASLLAAAVRRRHGPGSGDVATTQSAAPFVATFLVAAGCGTIAICLDQAGIALGRPSGTVVRYLLGGAVMLGFSRSPRWRPTEPGRGRRLRCLDGELGGHLRDGRGAARALGRLPLPGPGPHRRAAAPPGRGCAEPPPHADRAASRPPGPAPGGSPGVTGSHGVLVSRLDAGGSPTRCRSRSGWCSSPRAYADHTTFAGPCGRVGLGPGARRLRRGGWWSSPTRCSPSSARSTPTPRPTRSGCSPSAWSRSRCGSRTTRDAGRPGWCGRIVAGLALAGAICLASVWAAPRGSTALAIAWVTTSSLGAVWAAWRLSRREQVG